MRCLLALLLSLTACHPAASISASDAGAARLALLNALAAACPPETADDLTPGLSPGARLINFESNGGRFLILIEPEIASLERRLAATPESSPDRVLAVDDLAEGYFTLELAAYIACLHPRMPEVATRSALKVEEDRVRKILEQLRRGREGAVRECATLARRYPEHKSRAPCAEF
jgi:hypothetical protein